MFESWIRQILIFLLIFAVFFFFGFFFLLVLCKISFELSLNFSDDTDMIRLNFVSSVIPLIIAMNFVHLVLSDVPNQRGIFLLEKNNVLIQSPADGDVLINDISLKN